MAACIIPKRNYPSNISAHLWSQQYDVAKNFTFFEHRIFLKKLGALQFDILAYQPQ